MAGYSSPVFLLNKMLEDDAVLKSIFAPKIVQVFPGYADEPYENMKSYPYIRYQFMPITQRTVPWLHTDWVQYFVGDTDFSKVVSAITRIEYLFNLPAFESLGLVVPDPEGKFKVMDCRVNVGTIPNQPSQDLGVWEQGLSLRIYYTVLQPSWSRLMYKQNGIDALLA